MKIKLIKLIFLIGSVVIVSCQSKDKKKDSTQGSSEQKLSVDSMAPIIEDSSKNKTTARENKKPVIVDSEGNKKNIEVANQNSTYAPLQLAIKNQEEDSILKEGSKLLMQNPNDVKALNAMAMAYYKKGQYYLAKNLLFRAQKVSPSSYEVHSNLGIVYLATEEKTEALRFFKKALELNPNDSVSASNAGSIYVQSNDYEKANITLEIAYKKGIKDFRILNNYAVTLQALNKNEKAEEIYKEILKENNNNKDVLVNYSILLIAKLAKYNDGLEVIQRLKFLGVPDESRSLIQDLESKARKDGK